MDFKSGIIEIKGEIFKPGYTFNDFQNSVFFEGQDGVRIIRLKGSLLIEGSNFIVSLLFRFNILYMISMMCIDMEISFSDEPKRKFLHDMILKRIGLESENYFKWGNIKSIYDKKSNISSINVVYNTL